MSKCCFCGKEIEYKVNCNDPRPIRVKGEEMSICCNECNARIVVPTRVAVWGMEKELKAKLAEKDKIYVESLIKLEKESEEQLEKQATIHYRHLKEKDQEKIEFAVEQLEKVKNYIIGNETYTFGDYPIVYVEDMTEAIDNQIKQLKEME